MGSEWSEEGLERPCYSVVRFAGGVAALCLALHSRDQEEVDEPANSEQACGAEPEGAGLGFSVVEAVSAGKAEDPEDVADRFGVGVVRSIHAPILWGGEKISNGNGAARL